VKLDRPGAVVGDYGGMDNLSLRRSRPRNFRLFFRLMSEVFIER